MRQELKTWKDSFLRYEKQYLEEHLGDDEKVNELYQEAHDYNLERVAQLFKEDELFEEVANEVIAMSNDDLYNYLSTYTQQVYAEGVDATRDTELRYHLADFEMRARLKAINFLTEDA